MNDDDKTPVDREILDFSPLEAFEAKQRTPTTGERCPQCRGPIQALANWIPPPRTRQEAWAGWTSSCVRNQSMTWFWCPNTGLFYESSLKSVVLWPRPKGEPPMHIDEAKPNVMFTALVVSAIVVAAAVVCGLLVHSGCSTVGAPLPDDPTQPPPAIVVNKCKNAVDPDVCWPFAARRDAGVER